MNAAVLLYHLRELGIIVALGDGAHTLELEAPYGVLTAELTELLHEHRDDLLQLVFEEEERAAIQEIDGCSSPSLVVSSAPVTSSVFSPQEALERVRAVEDDRAFKSAPESAATWQPPADFLERMEATFA